MANKKYQKTEHFDADTKAALIQNYAAILNTVGEDISREGLEKTPERAAKALQFLTQGYELDAAEIKIRHV